MPFTCSQLCKWKKIKASLRHANTLPASLLSAQVWMCDHSGLPSKYKHWIQVTRWSRVVISLLPIPFWTIIFVILSCVYSCSYLSAPHGSILWSFPEVKCKNMCFAVKICFVRARKTKEIDILVTKEDVAVGNKNQVIQCICSFYQ